MDFCLTLAASMSGKKTGQFDIWSKYMSTMNNRVLVASKWSDIFKFFLFSIFWQAWNICEMIWPEPPWSVRRNPHLIFQIRMVWEKIVYFSYLMLPLKHKNGVILGDYVLNFTPYSCSVLSYLALMLIYFSSVSHTSP